MLALALESSNNFGIGKRDRWVLLHLPRISKCQIINSKNAVVYISTILTSRRETVLFSETNLGSQNEPAIDSCQVKINWLRIFGGKFYDINCDHESYQELVLLVLIGWSATKIVLILGCDRRLWRDKSCVHQWNLLCFLFPYLKILTYCIYCFQDCTQGIISLDHK